MVLGILRDPFFFAFYCRRCLDFFGICQIMTSKTSIPFAYLVSKFSDQGRNDAQ